MLVVEAKLKGKPSQYAALDEAIRTARFVQNSCLRYWMDNQGVGKYDLNKYCATLAATDEFPWCKQLNSMARQAHAERAWSAIARFYDNCKRGKPGKKGYPQFKKHRTRASVEYKTSGWKFGADRSRLVFTDGFAAGEFKLLGSRDLGCYDLKQFKRVRVVRRSDGYYAQFCLDVERREERQPTGRTVGLDVGLAHFYTDSTGGKVENPRHLRQAERRLKRAAQRVSRKQQGSANRRQAVNRLGRAHLKVQRQRKDFAIKQARCVIESADFIAFEDLKVRNLVRNRHLAKSISDAAWGQFRRWLEYLGQVYGVVTVAVPPQMTSQQCSACGEIVRKTLSQRTHLCPHCGHTQDRDHNAAINILRRGLQQYPGKLGNLDAYGENNRCSSQVTDESKLAL